MSSLSALRPELSTELKGFEMTYRLHELDPLDACYKVAKAYPGGVPALAARMGKQAQTLQKKLMAHVESHGLTLDEFSSIVDLTAGARCPDALLPIRALCWRHGGVFLQMPDPELMEDSAFLSAVIHTAREQGDVIRRVEEALANDGKFDARELEDIEREIEEAIGAQSTLLEMVRKMARGSTRHG
jgi:hypothetical protein